MTAARKITDKPAILSLLTPIDILRQNIIAQATCWESDRRFWLEYEAEWRKDWHERGLFYELFGVAACVFFRESGFWKTLQSVKHGP